MVKILLIVTAGGAGALLRFALTNLVDRLAGADFPAGTLVVNVLGCLVAGAMGAVLAGPHNLRAEHQAMLMIGLLGAFTTFSTFGLQTVELMNQGRVGAALLNVGLSNVLGIGAVLVGYRVVGSL